MTPDSFSDGGQFLEPASAVAQARRLLAEGADVIDVGGASSRPRGADYGAGAGEISSAEEVARVLPIVQELCELSATVSVDTTRAEVADAALEAGASIVNDVSCASHRELLEVAARHGAQYVVMHNRGDGAVHGDQVVYRSLVDEVLFELQAGVERAVAAGIAPAKIWIDPGLGFAKTKAQSITLLAATDRLVTLGYPVLVAASRKGFLGQLARRPSGEVPAPQERQPATDASSTIAALLGAAAVRVHDVAATRQAVAVALAILEARGAAEP